MAEWIYRRENRHGRCIVEPDAGGGDWNHLIARDVPHEHGPRIALAPRMEGVLRDLTRGVEPCEQADCDCLFCDAFAILRELDAAKESI